MVKTIGNPLTWVAQGLAGAGEHVAHSIEKVGGEHAAEPRVNTITTDDLRFALKKGTEDFAAARADVMFLCLIYPVIGVFLATIGFQMNHVPLLFPVAAGFALLGPLAASGLYEVSRRREKGEDVSWLAALGILKAENFGAILILGLYLMAIYLAWVIVAAGIYEMTMGPGAPVSLSGFVTDVFTTSGGWAMIVLGMAVGFVFALAVLAISVVSFPLLLDRNVGVPVAIVTSIRVCRENPRVIATWGLIVAAGLFLGSLPAFVGLIVVLPILGHATWHLYRRAVS